jgi:hypothetical protein
MKRNHFKPVIGNTFNNDIIDGNNDLKKLYKGMPVCLSNIMLIK